MLRPKGSSAVANAELSFVHSCEELIQNGSKHQQLQIVEKKKVNRNMTTQSDRVI